MRTDWRAASDLWYPRPTRRATRGRNLTHVTWRRYDATRTIWRRRKRCRREVWWPEDLRRLQWRRENGSNWGDSYGLRWVYRVRRNRSDVIDMRQTWDGDTKRKWTKFRQFKGDDRRLMGCLQIKRYFSKIIYNLYFMCFFVAGHTARNNHPDHIQLCTTLLVSFRRQLDSFIRRIISYVKYLWG